MEQFLASPVLRRACQRSLEIIGEASKQVDPSFKAAHPQVPWKDMAAMRQRLIHGSFGVDDTIVWDVVKTHNRTVKEFSNRGRRHLAGQMSDEELLTRAAAIDRVLFTQDSDFLEIAARWQRQGVAFSRVLVASQGTPIGRMIEDAELCLAGMTVAEFRNRLVHLPLQ